MNLSSRSTLPLSLVFLWVSLWNKKNNFSVGDLQKAESLLQLLEIIIWEQYPIPSRDHSSLQNIIEHSIKIKCLILCMKDSWAIAYRRQLCPFCNWRKIFALLQCSHKNLPTRPPLVVAGQISSTKSEPNQEEPL